MKVISLFLLMLAFSGPQVFACDDACKADEIYSDAEELCVPVPAMT